VNCCKALRMPCCLLVLGFASIAHAQETSKQDKPPPYRLFRFDEDYRYLQDPTKRSDVWDPIKYIPLGFDSIWYLSLGGELRERFEFYSHPNMGLQGQGPNGYLLHRILLHADVHAGEYFRAFVQLGNHLAPWKDNPAPPYQDQLDLQQAFVDLRLPFLSGAEPDPILRLGRQEMAFGSQRLVAIRDAPNVRRNFDGARLSGTIEGVSVDAFVTRPVQQKDGVFNDPSDPRQAFWGLYTTMPAGFVPGAKLDAYYLGFENKQALYAAGLGEEHRQTLGTRFFGSAGGWDWDWEALGQFGTFAQKEIRAWGFSTDTGYTFDPTGWKVRLSLKADIGSGDHNLSGATLGTLNPLFPKLAYFNQAAILGPSNVMDLQPTLSFSPARNLKLTVGYDFLWRETTADAVYTGVGAPVAGTAGQPGRFTGSQFSVDLAWQLDRHIEIDLGYVHFDPSKVLTTVHGREVNFTYFSAVYRF
jgi:hypothetical protein